MKTSIKFLGEDVNLELIISKYPNERLAIVAFDLADGCRFGTLTVNVPEFELNEGEIIVKTYSDNEEWVPQVLKNLSKHFIPTGNEVNLGYVTVPIYKFSE